MSPSPPHERPRKRRWPRRLLLGGVIVAGLLFVFRRPVLGALVVSQLERAAAEAGGRLTVRSVGGSWIDDVILEGVDWTTESTTVRGARVQVQFSLWDALRGKPTWLRRVAASASSIELDLSQPGVEGAGSSSFELPTYLPPATVEVGRLEIDLADGEELACDDLLIELVERGPVLDWSVSGRLDDGRLQAEGSCELSAPIPELRVTRLDVAYGSNRLTSDGLVVPLSFTSASEALRHTQGGFDVVIIEPTPSLSRLELAACFDEGGRADLTGIVVTPAGAATLRAGSIELDEAVDDLLGAAVVLELDVALDSLGPVGELLGRDPWSGALHGQLAISGSLGSPVGELHVSANAVELEGFAIGALDVDARWSASDETVLIEELTLVRTDADAAWRLAEPASLSFLSDGVACERFELSSSAGSATLSLSVEDGRTEFGLELASFDFDLLEGVFLPPDWLLGALSGQIDGVVDGNGTHVDFQLATPEFRPGADHPTWRFDLRGRLSPDRFVLEQLEGETSAGGILRARAELPLDLESSGVLATRVLAPGEIALALEAENLDLEAWTELVPEDGRARGKVDLEVELAGSWEHPRGALRLVASDLEPRVSLFPAELSPLAATLAVELGERVTVREATLSAGAGITATFVGALEAVIDVPRLVEDPTWLLGVPIGLTGELAAPDLTWLARSVDELRRLEGRVAARGRLAGTLRDPRWQGEVELREGEFRLATGLPTVRGLEADLVVDNRRWELRSATGEMGGAEIALTGTVDASGEAVVLDLRLTGERMLLVRTSETKIRANARLAIQGPIEKLRATGELVVTEGRHVRDIDIFSALGGSSSAAPDTGSGIHFSISNEPPLADMEFDVALKSEGPLVVDNNLTRAEFRPDLRLRGTGRLLILNGPVFIDPSTISLPSGKLRVNAGILDFRFESPFVPDLSLTAEMRVRGYDIDATVSGPYDNPEILLSSSPPLPDDELLLLFLTGQLPSTEDSATDAAGAVAIFLAQDVLSRWLFGSDVDGSEDVMDRIEFTVGAEVSRTGTPTARATYYLRARPRGVGRTSYLTAERDAWDRINYGIGFVFRFR